MRSEWLGKVLDEREKAAGPVKFEVGDFIVFRAQTMWSNAKAKRKCTGKTAQGKPTVKYNGFDDFALRWNEIIEVIPAWRNE
tara:strand:- start:2545 stop:2790 length:246 start_codon:yes stop_codon:yes gene_type:complete